MLPRSKKLARPSLCTTRLPYGRPVREDLWQSSGREQKAQCENDGVRHCEERSDEAIQNGLAATASRLDCFASLAMTRHLSPLRGGKSSEASVRGHCRESERSRSSASAIHNDQSSGSAYAPSPRPSPRAAGRGSGTGTRRIAGLSFRIVMRARRPCASRRSIAADRSPGGTGNSRTIW